MNDGRINDVVRHDASRHLLQLKVKKLARGNTALAKFQGALPIA